MAHDDQFTATGPPLAGSGFPRSGFSTRATRMVYGANVQGDKVGLNGESVRAETGRESHLGSGGIGVYGVGDVFGVFGRIHRRPGNAGQAGVVGQHSGAGVGTIGAVLTLPNGRGGIGVAGISHTSLNPPVFESLPDPAAGSGTGVFGSSGSGTGVRGTSATSSGVRGESRNGDAVVGTSGSGRGGLFESGGSEDGAVAQVGLVPQQMPVPDVMRSTPVQFDSRAATSLPRAGRGGDLLATEGEDGNCTLWFCTRSAEGDKAAAWCQVLLGSPVGSQGVAEVLWPGRVVASVGSSSEDPRHILSGPDGTTYTLIGGGGATFGEFRGRLYPELADLLSANRVTHGDAMSPEDLARADVIAFERNGSSPAQGGGWESCDWSFADGLTTVSVAWDEHAGAPRDSHVVANGSVRGADYVRCFDASATAGHDPIGDAEVISFLVFSIPEVRTQDPGFTVAVRASTSPTAGEATPDIDAIGLMPPRR